MTKVQSIQAMIDSGVITAEAGSELITLISKDTGGRAAANPDIMVDGEITERYCNLHQAYEPIEKFSKKGTKKECQAGVWRWNKINRDMKKMVDDMMDVDTKLTAADYNKYKADYNELKASRVPGASGYNYDIDNADYLTATTKTEDA